MAVWGLGFFEAPSSRTNTFSAATGCAAVMGRSVGNVPAALTFLPSSVYWIPSQEKGYCRCEQTPGGSTGLACGMSSFFCSSVRLSKSWVTR